MAVFRTFYRLLASLLLLPCLVFAETGTQGAVQGQKVLDDLVAGNSRFVKGKRTYPDLTAARRTDLDAKGQHPVATVLCCSDSRVPPEHLFDLGLGDLFIVRVAGNVADTDEIGSIEYGAEHLGTPLLLVLGHSKCGAVTAVYKGDKVGGSIPSLVDNVIPAVSRAQKAKGMAFSDEGLDLAIRENVLQSVSDILARSSIVRELVETGKLQVAGGIYHLDSGAVELIDVGPASLAKVSETAAKPEATEAPGGKPAEASTAPESGTPAVVLGLSPGLSGAIAAILLGLVCFILLFAEKTRIKRIKFKVRIILGTFVYLVLGMAPVFMELSDKNVSWGSGSWFALANGIFILVLLLLSMNTLSNHLGRIYHELTDAARNNKGYNHE